SVSDLLSGLLRDQVSQLHMENTLLRTQTTVPCLEQRFTMPLPEQFNGSRQPFWGFMNQCHLLFLLCPQTYVSVVISLLKGEALDWTSPLLESNSPVLSNWNTFLQSISAIFDDLHRGRLAEEPCQRHHICFCCREPGHTISACPI
uniref:DUF4939 domain-containing protein n=1 Tax=Terrapene triunguis TaxID=2587831 RepID=A0A674J3V2_9SAUR